MELLSSHFEVKTLGGRNYHWTVDGGVVSLNLPEDLFVPQPDSGHATCSLGLIMHNSFLECGPKSNVVRASLPAVARIIPAGTPAHPTFIAVIHIADGGVRSPMQPR